MKAVSVKMSQVQVAAGGKKILDIGELDIKAGEFVAITGTNGAGKSTLIKVCCGLIKPNRGAVIFNDINIYKVTGWRQSNLRKHIGYIPQATEYNAELPFTVSEIVAMGPTAAKALLQKLNSNDRKTIDYWIDQVGLSDRKRQTFRSLSGGQQQKVLIARAMATEPGVLMFDEPCSSLDFNWKYQITEMIDRLYQANRMTVLMVCHEINLLPQGCNRVILLHDGRIVADGDKEQVINSQAIRDAYQCEMETVKIGGRDYVINKGI
ncbi:MAG TPA: metal ABC transporter ATP-binding protein [Sedimentisphaerales bacterium]|nr:metal ABC transporter ATP-binding protein [Sedimentisphaerales bacterium]